MALSPPLGFFPAFLVHASAILFFGRFDLESLSKPAEFAVKRLSGFGVHPGVTEFGLSLGLENVPLEVWVFCFHNY